MLKIESAGERMTFRAYSADRDGTYYLVDLTANDGLGACQCPDFSSRVQKLIDEGYPYKNWPEPMRTECKHLFWSTFYLGLLVRCRAVGKTFEELYGQAETAQNSEQRPMDGGQVQVVHQERPAGGEMAG